MTTTDIILNFLGGVLIAIGILTFIYAFWKSSAPAFGGLSIRKMLKFKRTFRRLFEGICIGAVQDENGVKHIFETSFNTSTNQYNDFLKRFNAWIATNTHDLTSHDIAKVTDFITPIINAELEGIPDDGLSEDDKYAISSIETMVAESNNKEAIRSQLRNISNSLVRFNHRIKKESLLNRTALLVSIASMLITLGLHFLGKSSISENSLESINNHTDQKIELAVDSICNSLIPLIQDNNKSK